MHARLQLVKTPAEWLPERSKDIVDVYLRVPSSIPQSDSENKFETVKPSFVASLHSCAHQLVRTAIETAAAAGTRMAAQEHVDALLLGTVRFFMACGTPWHVLQWFIIYTSALTLHLQIGRREGALAPF